MRYTNYRDTYDDDIMDKTSLLLEREYVEKELGITDDEVEEYGFNNPNDPNWFSDISVQIPIKIVVQFIEHEQNCYHRRWKSKIWNERSLHDFLKRHASERFNEIVGFCKGRDDFNEEDLKEEIINYLKELGLDAYEI